MLGFIRTDILHILQRNKEHLLIACVGALFFYFMIEAHGVFLKLLFGLAAAFCGLGLFIAYRRGHFKSSKSDPGVVLLDERRLSYFGPDYGGTLSLNDLNKVEIITTDDGPFLPDVFWYLHTHDQVLRIPSGAKDADILFDAFSVLSDFDWSLVTLAMGSTEREVFVIWQAQ